MSKLRLAILILGPAPIVAASMAVSQWAKPEAPTAPPSNLVVRGQSENVAYGDEGLGQKPATKPARTTAIKPPSSPSGSTLEVACSQTAVRLRKQLGRGCHVIARPPFVIGGDLDEQTLANWHQHTIGPAAKAMANCYFRTPPSQPITVLLFEGEQSYNYFADKLFSEAGISIYGYYKPNLRTLVMNIGTGGGTLVHELTHALMDFDFPNVPDWFNEGLASLHEQCNFRDDRSGPWIEGQVNWRLPGLQEAIRRKRLRSLQSLVEDNDFRGKLEGTNYAQARYFCMYMQERGVLRDYFRAFHSSYQDDPRGAGAVSAVFPSTSWRQLDKDFQTWVMTLKRSS